MTTTAIRFGPMAGQQTFDLSAFRWLAGSPARQFRLGDGLRSGQEGLVPPCSTTEGPEGRSPERSLSRRRGCSRSKLSITLAGSEELSVAETA